MPRLTGTGTKFGLVWFPVGEAPRHSSQGVTMTTERIILIHKADGSKASKPSKVAIASSHSMLESARVRRPGLEAFIESGKFATLDSIPQAIIDNPLRRREEFPEAFFIIDESDMGRPPKSGERDYASTCQSILLWIKKHYAETEKPLVRIGELSVIVETL